MSFVTAQPEGGASRHPTGDRPGDGRSVGGAVGTHEVGAYWDNVGRELLQRSRDDQSSIASDDTPHHSLRQRRSFEEFHDTPYYSIRQRHFFEEFLDPAFRDVSSILEIGPGPGGNLNRLRSQGKTVFGAEVSEIMVNIARLNGLNSIVQIDGSHLPFEDKFCDAVFTSTVLQHNTKERAASLLAEIARVAAKEVHLFEDTALIPLRDRRLHWLRPPSWYVSLLESQGYELTFQRRLPLACQEVAATIARVLIDRQRGQKARATARRLRLEAILCGAARPVDRYVPPMVGLTRMSFRRTDG
jgi:SAM-dependent methyltransferase